MGVCLPQHNGAEVSVRWQQKRGGRHRQAVRSRQPQAVAGSRRLSAGGWQTAAGSGALLTCEALGLLRGLLLLLCGWQGHVVAVASDTQAAV